MAAKLTILGVHPVAADEPCHIVEILLEGTNDEFDFGDVTQEIADQPRANWQVAYDEQLLEKSDRKSRYAFFFHYLDLGKPLRTPLGLVALPPVTRMPTHLKSIKYEAP
jgi:hypothetical protein